MSNVRTRETIEQQWATVKVTAQTHIQSEHMEVSRLFCFSLRTHVSTVDKNIESKTPAET